jgi:hypothetical protein
LYFGNIQRWPLPIDIYHPVQYQLCYDAPNGTAKIQIPLGWRIAKILQNTEFICVQQTSTTYLGINHKVGVVMFEVGKLVGNFEPIGAKRKMHIH